MDRLARATVDRAGQIQAASRALVELLGHPPGQRPERLEEVLAPSSSGPGHECLCADGKRVPVTVFERSLPAGARELLLVPEHARHDNGYSAAVGTLAGGIAHQLNNLLTAVVQSTELMSMDSPSPELVEVVREATRRASELTQQLLVVAQKHSHEPEDVALDPFVAKIVSAMRERGEATIDLKLNAPDVRVRIDPPQLAGALEHVLDNALDATDGTGQLRVSTDVAPGQSGGAPQVQVRVTDSGCGMDDETLHRAFDPFFTTKGTALANGLGLATARAVVERHGGAMRGTSALGAGTTMEVFLPIASEPERPVRTPAQAATASDQARQRVLLVEDERLVRSVAQRCLEAAGFEVVAVASGEEALQRATDDGDLDLLLVDVVLPGISGPEVAQRLRDRFQELRILFVSGYTEGVDVQRLCQTLGADFLPKPYSAATLVNRTRQAISGRRAEP